MQSMTGPPVTRFGCEKSQAFLQLHFVTVLFLFLFFFLGGFRIVYRCIYLRYKVELNANLPLHLVLFVQKNKRKKGIELNRNRKCGSYLRVLLI